MQQHEKNEPSILCPRETLAARVVLQVCSSRCACSKRAVASRALALSSKPWRWPAAAPPSRAAPRPPPRAARPAPPRGRASCGGQRQQQHKQQRRERRLLARAAPAGGGQQRGRREPRGLPGAALGGRACRARRAHVWPAGEDAADAGAGAVATTRAPRRIARRDSGNVEVMYRARSVCVEGTGRPRRRAEERLQFRGSAQVRDVVCDAHAECV